MRVLDNPETDFLNHATSTAGARILLSSSLTGSSAGCSDPYTEWAIRFDQSLRRAEERIHGWSRNRSAILDDGLTPPTGEAVAKAISLISRLKVLVMDRVAPSGATLLNLQGVSLGGGGEISFELVAKPFAVTYRVEEDGTVTHMVFKNGELVLPPQKLPV